MGFKTAEQRKEYNKKYYQKTRLKQLEQKKIYNELHKEEISIKNKKYREKNRTILNEYNNLWYKQNKETKVKDYNNSENGKKINKKHEWKRNGLNMDDFDNIYEKHINVIYVIYKGDI